MSRHFGVFSFVIKSWINCWLAVLFKFRGVSRIVNVILSIEPDEQLSTVICDMCVCNNPLVCI